MLRHGQTAWSVSGQHTGHSDIPLTDAGRAAAAKLAQKLQGHAFAWVACSPLQRAQETAKLAGLQPDETLEDLIEWDYGSYEGRTTAQIRADLDDDEWVIWDGLIPGGEQPEDVGVRCQRVIERCLPYLEADEEVALVSHGHLLRMLTATWLRLEPRCGRLFKLETGTLSGLGFEREQRVIDFWNSLHLPRNP